MTTFKDRAALLDLPAFMSAADRFLVSRSVDRDGKITKPPFRVSDGQLFDAWHPAVSEHKAILFCLSFAELQYSKTLGPEYRVSLERRFRFILNNGGF
jgi:hypothetical protein